MRRVSRIGYGVVEQTGAYPRPPRRAAGAGFLPEGAGIRAIFWHNRLAPGEGTEEPELLATRSLAPQLLKISDWFLGSRSGPDAEDLVRRGRLLLVLIALSVFILAWTGAYQLQLGSEFAGRTCLVAIPLALIPALALRLGAPIAFITHLSVAILYGITLAITLTTGGRWPAGLFFLVLVPVEALLIVGRRGGLVWSGVVLASLPLAAWYTSLPGYAPLFALSDLETQAAAYRTAALVTIAVFATGFFYASLHERANRALRASVASHQQGERRFRALVENAYDLITELDEQGRITFASPGYEESIGLSPVALIGRSALETIHPEDRARMQAAWAVMLQKGAVQQEAVRYVAVDRGVRFFDVSLRSYRTMEEGLRVVAVSREVTERLERERLIRHQQNLVTMGTMAAGTAHQLSNPIGSILSAAQYAKQFSWRSDFGTIAGECLDGIEEDARRASLILKSMLSFAREEPAERWVEQLDLVIYRALTAVRAQSERAGTVIEVRPCREQPRTRMSPIEIEQVLINLLRNAIEAHARRIVVDTRVLPGDRVELTIADDGAGIPDEVRASLFDPFVTTRPGAASGLGLSVAREIVVDHGGSIELVRSGDEGTVFRIELPRMAPARDPGTEGVRA